MSDYIKRLEAMKKQEEKPEIKREEIIPPSSNQLKKIERENRDLKQKYDKLKHHELSEENLIDYFMGIKQAKLYELSRFFDLNAAHEIEKNLKELVTKQIIRKYKNGWFRINPHYKNSKKR